MDASLLDSISSVIKVHIVIVFSFLKNIDEAIVALAAGLPGGVLAFHGGAKSWGPQKPLPSSSILKGLSPFKSGLELHTTAIVATVK